MTGIARSMRMHQRQLWYTSIVVMLRLLLLLVWYCDCCCRHLMLLLLLLLLVLFLLLLLPHPLLLLLLILLLQDPMFSHNLFRTAPISLLSHNLCQECPSPPAQVNQVNPERVLDHKAEGKSI